MTAVQLSKLEAPAVMEGTQNQDTGSIHLICIGENIDSKLLRH